MIHVLVMANDSVLADIIVSTLAKEIDVEVVRMTFQEVIRGDEYSVVILVDEDESVSEPFRFMDLFHDGIPLLLIKVSIKSRNIFVYENYEINNPSMERVVKLVRDFGKAKLKKKVEDLIKNSFSQTRNPLEIVSLWRSSR
jgi:hypothetical protein